MKQKVCKEEYKVWKEVPASWRELWHKTMCANYRRAGTQCRQQCTETHVGPFYGWAFLYRHITKCSIAWNYLHLLAIKKNKTITFSASSKFNSSPPGIWCGFQFCSFPSLTPIILRLWLCPKRQNTFHKAAGPADGYSLRNWRLHPAAAREDRPGARCQAGGKGRARTRAARPALQVKCWLVDV